MISYKKPIVYPETGNPSTQPFDAKSFIRNIFHLNPAFAIFCADVVISADPNSTEAKILAKRYQKLRAIDQDKDKDNAMPVRPSVSICTHIKVTGVRCGSPALRGEQFCYFHQRMMRGVQIPNNARIHPVALIENEEAIQASLMEVINALARNTIDLKRAELILRALHISVKNARRVNFGLHSGEMVKKVPDYTTTPVERAALTRPGGQELPGRSAVELDSTPPDPAQRKPPARAGFPAGPPKAASQPQSAKASGG
jgi:hypothetical protein